MLLATPPGVGPGESTDDNSTSGLRRSGVLSTSGADDRHDVPAATDQPGWSAAARDGGERRRKRTSKSSEPETGTQQRTSARPQAPSDGAAAVSDVHLDFDSTRKTAKTDKNEDGLVNGHVDVAPVTVPKDATVPATDGPRLSKLDADVVSVKPSDHKTAFRVSEASKGRDFDHHVNGYQEVPVAVANNATVAIAGGSRSSGDYRQKFDFGIVALKTSDHKTASSSAVDGDTASEHTVNGLHGAPVVVAEDATASQPRGDSHQSSSAEDHERPHEIATDVQLQEDRQVSS